MNNTTTLPEIQTSATLEDRIRIEASRQQHDLRESYAAVSALPQSRLARQAALVNARLHVLAYDVIDFYSRRYNGAPAQAPAPYTARDAERDILAAGVPYWMVSVITRDAKTKPEVTAAIDAYFDHKTATNARHAATLARIQRQSVVA